VTQAGTLRIERRPGRPRDTGMRDRVLRATVDLLAEMRWPITVADVVERSGASRAAIYRRWDSFDALLAEALDVGRAPVMVREDLPLHEALVETYLGEEHTRGIAETERVIRRRVWLSLANPALQRQYWRAHVARRRVPVARALARGVESGWLLADLDIDAAIDLLSGIFYYQIVTRGVSLADSETRARVADAFEIVWRGMLR
jgi:AcrR family transcriptional regulator